MGNGSGVKVGTGAVNDITPFVLIYIKLQLIQSVYIYTYVDNIDRHPYGYFLVAATLQHAAIL